MREPIQERAGEDRIAKDLNPARELQVGGNKQALPLTPLGTEVDHQHPDQGILFVQDHQIEVQPTLETTICPIKKLRLSPQSANQRQLWFRDRICRVPRVSVGRHPCFPGLCRRFAGETWLTMAKAKTTSRIGEIREKALSISPL